MSGFSLSLLLVSAFAVADSPDVDYLRDIKPILAARCYSCHGAIKQRGALRLDTAELMRQGGETGPALAPGQSAQSLLVKRLLGQEGMSRMPPKSAGEPLKDTEIALIRRWIDKGALAPRDEQAESAPRDHWAFQKPVRPALPPVKNTAWVRNPIDAFIAAEHEKRGLTPQPPADKGLLLRRVYLDLLGLPPTHAELDAFLKDTSPDAYEKVVDRLLASPQYGERWGRHWMDIWRYSDWWGLGAELRNSQKHIWHWRDWIVESLNSDKGYDRMVLEMLAADELYPTDADALRGTGFLARHYFKFNRTTWLDETIEHTSKAFLGLTINCSKCHDHKYDPISQEDYYRFRAFFEPYQIRLDQVPGQLDFEKDGIPRVFDGNLDTPTFLHIRGDEQRPDKGRKIEPALPRFFAPREFVITPVHLPPTAQQPGLRSFVLQDHLHAAGQELTAAKAQLEKVRQQLAQAEKQAQEPGTDNLKVPGKPLVQDDFTRIDKTLWAIGPGQWQSEGGKLLQKQDGDTWAVLALKQMPPADFEARFKFAILGGKQWRSVGIVFDEAGAAESLVYLTAHAGEPRVQFAHKQGGNYVYPAEAKQRRSVPLNQPQEMLLRVRGGLLNVSINGGPPLAHALPKGRHAGKLSLITFDAQARFEQFTLAVLPAHVPLVPAGGKAAVMVTIPQARADVTVAEKMIAAAEQKMVSLKARAAADRALAESAATTKEAAKKAALAEKQLAVAAAELALAKAEAEAISKGKEGEARVKQARTTLAAAQKAVANPGETYTPLAGALKTPESNLETEASRRKPFPKISTGRRSALAQWIASRDNPLTARVAVNHIWARHFGQPLVATVFDLGRKGAAPTHPQLLDWLAVELMDPSPPTPLPASEARVKGWSMKHLHRLMVTSNTYRLSSSAAGASAANREKDRDNHYYWRRQPQRMESQVVRDSLLYLAGELDQKLGGPSVERSQQEDSRRRSLYFFHSAIERNRFLATFDEADPLDCYRRRESIIPQQALALSNSRLALSMAERLTQRLEQHWSQLADRAFAHELFLTLLAYEPSEQELSACEQAMSRWRVLFQGQGDAAHRTRFMLVHTLLNHNDFVTVR